MINMNHKHSKYNALYRNAHITVLILEPKREKWHPIHHKDKKRERERRISRKGEEDVGKRM